MVIDFTARLDPPVVHRMALDELRVGRGMVEDKLTLTAQSANTKRLMGEQTPWKPTTCLDELESLEPARKLGRREFAVVLAPGHRVGGMADFRVSTDSPGRHSILLMVVRGFRYPHCNSSLGRVR